MEGIGNRLCSRQAAGRVLEVCAITTLAASVFSLLGAYSRSPVQIWAVEGNFLAGLTKAFFLNWITGGIGGLTREFATSSLVATGVGLGFAGGGLLYASHRCLEGR